MALSDDERSKLKLALDEAQIMGDMAPEDRSMIEEASTAETILAETAVTLAACLVSTNRQAKPEHRKQVQRDISLALMNLTNLPLSEDAKGTFISCASILMADSMLMELLDAIK